MPSSEGELPLPGYVIWLKGLSLSDDPFSFFLFLFYLDVEQRHGPGPRGGVQDGLQAARPGAHLQPGAILLAPGAQRQARDQRGPLQLREEVSRSELCHSQLGRRVAIWKNSSSVLLILLYLSVRLQELNFEVKVYDNHKQEEVLDKIGEGAHVRSQICWRGNHPARDVTASFIYNCL